MIINVGYERIWKEAAVPCLKLLPSPCLKRLMGREKIRIFMCDIPLRLRYMDE